MRNTVSSVYENPKFGRYRSLSVKHCTDNLPSEEKEREEKRKRLLLSCEQNE